jgi:hypothetical protein
MTGNVTLQQLNEWLSDVIAAIGNPTLEIRRADGSSKKYRSMSEALEAKASLEDMIRELQGGGGSRVALARHSRGDGLAEFPFGNGWSGGWR